jgi:subfamily B ATP-binding cassette protein HlyB/CyaB
MGFEEQSAHLEDAGLAALVVIARFHGIAADASQLRHAVALEGCAFSEAQLVLAARQIGLRASAVKLEPERLAKAPFPVLALDRAGRHFILAGSDGATALVLEPGMQAPRTKPVNEVMERSNGRMLLFTSRAALAGSLARFDFSWFIPAVVKYRRLLFEVLLVSMVLQVFGLVSPLMFQVVMDKVLVNRAYSTLNVVCVALLVSSVFEVLLTGLRNYVFSHTTNRIDVELGARLFRHQASFPNDWASRPCDRESVSRLSARRFKYD